MGQHRLPKPGRPGRRLTALTLTAGGALLLPASVGHAAPKPSLDQIQAQVDALYEEAEAATEQFNGLDEKQQQLQSRTGTLQQELAREQDQVNRVRETLGAVAAEQYRTGGIDPAVRLMLTSDATDYLTHASLQDTAAATQVDTLRSLQSQQRRLDQLRSETASQLGELDSARRAAAAKKTEVKQKLAEVQNILSGLKADERAKVLSDGSGQAASRGTARGTYNGPATGRVKDILDFAYAQLGKPYVWGATGPNSYDCSGLTLKAFAAGGVSLPRTSQAQYAAGQKISRDQLQPGDLVFYYSDLHHVGIYIGNGQLLHAPRSGKTVEIVPYDVMPYAGAVRF